MCVTDTGAVKSDHTSRLQRAAAGTMPGGAEHDAEAGQQRREYR